MGLLYGTIIKSYIHRIELGFEIMHGRASTVRISAFLFGWFVALVFGGEELSFSATDANMGYIVHHTARLQVQVFLLCLL